MTITISETEIMEAVEAWAKTKLRDPIHNLRIVQSCGRDGEPQGVHIEATVGPPAPPPPGSAPARRRDR